MNLTEAIEAMAALTDAIATAPPEAFAVSLSVIKDNLACLKTMQELEPCFADKVAAVDLVQVPLLNGLVVFTAEFAANGPCDKEGYAALLNIVAKAQALKRQFIVLRDPSLQ
jgi:hypothetical protein